MSDRSGPSAQPVRAIVVSHCLDRHGSFVFGALTGVLGPRIVGLQALSSSFLFGASGSGPGQETSRGGSLIGQLAGR